MSVLNESINDTLPDAVYYDVLATNFQSTTTPPNIFVFNEARSNPYIQNPSLYDLSILRFNIDTGTLPIFIPSIQPNQPDRNLTIYSVTLVGNANNSGGILPFAPVQKFVRWNPQDKSALQPLPPSQTTSGTQDNRGGYYNCYSYQWFLYEIYIALQSALGDVLAQYVSAGIALPNALTPSTCFSPVITWQYSSQSFILQAQLDLYSELVDSGIQIYFNAPLFSLFNSFPSVYEGYSNSLATFGRNNRIVVANIGGSNTSQLFPANIGVDDFSYTVVNVYGEYSTTAPWSAISSIVFTSNTLPIEPNQVSTPLIFVNGLPALGGNNANSEQVITDIVSDTGLYRPSLTYVPSAEYRRIHLYGNRPLHNLDISIYYRLRTSELVPFRLSSGGTVSLKIGFLKKRNY
jgi:hypothetical protein